MPETAPAPVTLTHARVLKIALPIMVSNATIPILGVIDTGVVGQLGAAAPIGAVGIGAIILTGIYWIFGFLRMGTAGMTAQALGAGDHDEVAALLARALIFALGAGVVLILVQGPLFAGAFAIAPATQEVESLARSYMEIRVWSAPAAIAIFGLIGWLIAQERTRAVLAIQVWMNGLNILLDLWFVLGLGWGVNGVAIATFLAEWSGLVFGLWFCRDALRAPAMRVWSRIFDRARLAAMASVNTDILIRTLLLETIVVSFMFVGADFGDVTLAANQVLLQFLHVTSYALDGFAFAAEALVGRSMGARNRVALRSAALMTSCWGAATALVMAICFAAFGADIVALLTTSEPVRSEAGRYLPWMVFAPIAGAGAWMLDGIFIGATRTRDMRNMMLVCALIYGATAVMLVPILSNHGLWMALIVCYVARGLALGVKYPGLERAVLAKPARAIRPDRLGDA